MRGAAKISSILNELSLRTLLLISDSDAIAGPGATTEGVGVEEKRMEQGTRNEGPRRKCFSWLGLSAKNSAKKKNGERKLPLAALFLFFRVLLFALSPN